MGRRFAVGIVGLKPDRGWAARAHVPALRALPQDFELVGVANTSRESAERSATAMGIPKAFDDVSAMIASPEIDIVTITVRVPYHFEIAKAAIEGGKHVYCEWPLANGLKEAEDLVAVARSSHVANVVGTQAPFAPEIRHVRELVAKGFVGEVLSTTIVACGGAMQGGGRIPDKATYGYLLDRANGATMLTIPVGHALAAVRSVLGEVDEVSAVLATRRPVALTEDTGESLPVSAPDQVLVSATMSSGAPISIHYRGGASRDGSGLVWEIHGTEGDIRITGASGQVQMVPLSVTGARGSENSFEPLHSPSAGTSPWRHLPVEPRNVSQVYSRMAHDLRHRTRSAPDFEDALALHRLVAAVESAAETGVRARLSALPPAMESQRLFPTRNELS